MLNNRIMHGTRGMCRNGCHNYSGNVRGGMSCTGRMDQGYDTRDDRHDHPACDHTMHYHGNGHDDYAMQNHRPCAQNRSIPLQQGASCPLCDKTNYGGNERRNPCNPEGMTNCDKLLDQIRAVDFALVELVLYLDAYPDSYEALDTYHKLIARRKGLYAQYETSCGPLTAMGNKSTTSWDWINKPFPWEYNAN